MSMSNTEKKVKDIRRNTRRKFSTEEKIRIVLDGLRGREFSCRTLSSRGNQSQFVLPMEQRLPGRDRKSVV